MAKRAQQEEKHTITNHTLNNLNLAIKVRFFFMSLLYIYSYLSSMTTNIKTYLKYMCKIQCLTLCCLQCVMYHNSYNSSQNTTKQSLNAILVTTSVSQICGLTITLIYLDSL